MAGFARSPVDLSGYPHGAQSNLADKANEYWEDNLQVALDNKFILPHTLTPPELDLLNKLVTPLVCSNPSPDRNPGPLSFKSNYLIPTEVLRHPEHPVARSVSSIGDFFLRRRVDKIDNGALCEIGPAPAIIPRIKHHACSHISGRDTARLGSAAANHPNDVKLRLALANTETPEWCLNGVENCVQQHMVAIASDSIYDISPETMARTMENKGLQIVYATLWCPPHLLGPDGDYENDIYHLKLEKGRAAMDFKDTAFAYEHDINVWRAWSFECSYSNQKRANKEGSVAIAWETLQSWGPFKMIQITRVHGESKVFRAIPRDSTMVGVPNFTHVIDVIVNTKLKHFIFGSKDFRKALRLETIARAIANAPKLWIPAELYSKMLQFVDNRKDTDVERGTIGSALSAKCNRIEVDAFVLQSGLKLGGAEHRDLTLALMLIGTACRTLQTQLIGKVLRTFRDGPSAEGFFTSIWHMMFGDDKNPFGNFSGLTAAALVMAGDGPLTEMIANCVDEGYQREFTVGITRSAQPSKLQQKFTGRGGLGTIKACGCVTECKQWNQGKAWCIHGKAYSSNHTTFVPVAEVNVEQNYRFSSNLDKAASVVKIFEDYNGSKIMNSCAAPGNDGGFGFAKSNFTSKYLTRMQPSGKWVLDGNVHCDKCQTSMAYNYINHYMDYGSDCEFDYFHPEELSLRWRAGNKYVVKVQKGLELLAKGIFPKQFVGHYIAPVKCNGAEICVANFQANEGWQQIVALPPTTEIGVEANVERSLGGGSSDNGTQLNWEEENPIMRNNQQGADSSNQTEEIIPETTTSESGTSTGEENTDVNMPSTVIESTMDEISFGFDLNPSLIEEESTSTLTSVAERNVLESNNITFGFNINFDLINGKPTNTHLSGAEGTAIVEITEPEQDNKPTGTLNSVAEGTAVIPEVIHEVTIEDVGSEEEFVETLNSFAGGSVIEMVLEEPVNEEVNIEKYVFREDRVCEHKFPERPGCTMCLPVFEREEFDKEFGKEWYNPQTETECFASALLGRPATRKEIPLLNCIVSSQETSRLEAYFDPKRFDFLSERILHLLAVAMKIKIVIRNVDEDRTFSYGKGFPRLLKLENSHYTRIHNHCHECSLNEQYICTENHVIEWEKVHVPAFSIPHREKCIIRKELFAERRFVKFHTPIVDHIAVENAAFDINMIVGKAGSGKTFAAMEKLKNEQELIVIVPTRDLQEEYNRKYKKEGMKVQIWSQFCRSPTLTETILIDEVFMQHPLVVAIAARHCERLYAIGDPEQNDYGGKGTSKVIEHISKCINTGTVQIKCSRSVPLDVCRILHGFGIEIKTHSQVSHSLKPVVQRKPSRPINGMCFKNEEEKHGEWKTVNKMQGARFENGVLYLDSGFNAAAQLKPARAVYVALTRHTKELIIVCRNGIAMITFQFHHTCDQGGRAITACEGSTEFENTTIDIGENFTSRKRMKYVTEEIPTIVETVELDTVTEEVEGEELRRLGTKTDLEPVVDGLQCTVPSDYDISNFIFDQWIGSSNQPFDETNDVENLDVAIDEKIHSYVGHQGACFADAEEVLEKISPTNSSVYQPERNLEFRYYGRNFAGKSLSLQPPDRVSKEKAQHLVTNCRVRGRSCRSDDYSQTVQTVLGRYSKKVKLAKGEAAKAAGNRLFDGLMKALPRGLEKISDEEFANAQAAQVDRIAAKKEVQTGIFGDGYENTDKISFFLKGQIKSDLKANSWLRGGDDGKTYNLKAGQGVSAQPKPLNHPVGPWVTAAERKVVEALDARISLGYGRSPAQFRAKVKGMMSRNAKSDEVMCCDISEQDTSKGPWTNWFMRRLYRACGVPERIIDLIECANINWRIDGNGVRLKVKHKYQSGRADTLFANTMMNMGLIFSSVDVDNLKLALFQGDDSYIRASKVRLINENKNLKIERGPHGDFIGFLIGDDDIYLDLPRFVVKLMNRIFATTEEITNYRIAVYDWLRIFQDPEQLHKGLAENADKYHTSEEDMAVLFSFLRRFYLGKLFTVYNSKHTKANPNCVMAEVQPIVIGISERKSGPLSTMSPVDIK